MAASTVEWSYIDFRLSVNGFSSMLTAEIKNLFSDNCSEKVWGSGYLSFVLW